MNKIGIITIVDKLNYGNRLQNFAVQHTINKLGYSAETLDNNVYYKRDSSLKFLLKKIICLLYLNSPINGNKMLNNLSKYIKFSNFNFKYINWSSVIIDKNDLNPTYFKEFDCFIIGSDQIWNPYTPFSADISFAAFANSKKRIAFSPSFGCSEIPVKDKEKYTHYLNQIDCLSVREYAGQQIIKDLTGRSAEVLIDPTLMLSKQEWLEIASKPAFISKKKYLLTYVLGNETEEFKKFVKQVAKEKNLQILNLLDPLDKNIHCVDPSEFIYLINNADVMVTDSFHGAVFSIIMKTPFVIFERQDSHVSMNSRIDTLVSTFNMESRLSTHIKSIDDVYNIDFSHIDGILKHEREKAINYLKKAFSMN